MVDSERVDSFNQRSRESNSKTGRGFSKGRNQEGKLGLSD
jgi:hypothetical protein